MKSPREVLLNNHAEAVPALDAIRGGVVSELRRRDEGAFGRSARSAAFTPQQLSPATIITGIGKGSALQRFCGLKSALRLLRPARLRSSVSLSAIGRFFAEAWVQLIWRGRMSWGAIAAVWVGLFIVRGVALRDVAASSGSAMIQQADATRWLDRQEQLRAELGLPLRSQAAVAVRRKTPGPQSMSNRRDAVV